MKEKQRIILVLDKRRKKVSGLYPVKFRVSQNRSSFFVATGIDLSEDDFEKIKSGRRLSQFLEEVEMDLNSLKEKIVGTVSKLSSFSHAEFMRIYSDKSGNAKSSSVPYSIQEAFNLTAAKPGIKLGTRTSYQTTLNALQRFLKAKNMDVEGLDLIAIDVHFLRSFHGFLVDENKSLATIGIYMRTLRAVMNESIALNKFKLENYPFGRRKYIPPVAKSTKDVLSKDELKRMIQLQLEHPSLECFSRDWFVMCYLCNGMNIGDLLQLKNEDLRATGFHFIREKTRTTSNGMAGHVRVDFGESWRDLILEIISRQRNKDTRPMAYLFDCLPIDGSEFQRQRAKQLFIRKVNQHLSKVCKLAKIDKHVSSQTARHTFASNLYMHDVSISEIQSFLGHTSPKTTENYLHSLQNEKTKHAIENLL